MHTQGSIRNKNLNATCKPPDFNPVEMVWDELKSSQQVLSMWELQDYWKSIPGEAGWENAKSVQNCHQGKRWLLWRISYQIYFDLLNTFLVTTWFYVLFHSFNVFTIILQCRKTLEWVSMSKLLPGTIYVHHTPREWGGGGEQKEMEG